MSEFTRTYTAVVTFEFEAEVFDDDPASPDELARQEREYLLSYPEAISELITVSNAYDVDVFPVLRVDA